MRNVWYSFKIRKQFVEFFGKSTFSTRVYLCVWESLQQSPNLIPTCGTCQSPKIQAALLGITRLWNVPNSPVCKVAFTTNSTRQRQRSLMRQRGTLLYLICRQGLVVGMKVGAGLIVPMSSVRHRSKIHSIRCTSFTILQLLCCIGVPLQQSRPWIYHHAALKQLDKGFRLTLRTIRVSTVQEHVASRHTRSGKIATSTSL